MSRLRVRCVVAMTLVAVVAPTTSACSPEGTEQPAVVSSAPSASPSPSPEPTPDEADALEQESIAAAMQTVENYYDDLAAQGHAGYSDWEFVLVPYWSGDVLADESDRYARHHANGRTTTGRTDIVSMDVLEFTRSPGGNFDTVRLELCTDVSGVRAFEDGEELQRPEDATLRFRTELLLQDQNGERWTIHERTATGDQEC